MKTTQILRMRDRLLALRERLTGEIDRLDQARVELVRSGGQAENAASPLSPPSISDFDSDLAVDARLRDELREVEAALRRTQDGSYGQCLRCGREIPLARLEAVLCTAYCSECERQIEHS